MIKREIGILIFGLFLIGCVSTNAKYFSNIKPTDDKTYGYSAENPITIKNGDLQNSINSSYYYLSQLATEKLNKLRIIQRYSIPNPNYKKPVLPLANRYTGQPMNYGNGPILDKYILIPENEKDTIVLYINPYIKGNGVKIPAGLIFSRLSD